MKQRFVYIVERLGPFAWTVDGYFSSRPKAQAYIETDISPWDAVPNFRIVKEELR